MRVIGVDTVGSIYAYYKEHGKLPPADQIHQYLIDGIGEDFLPSTVWWDYIDEIVTIDDKTAYRVVFELAKKEAILVGSSAGAAAAGSPDRRLEGARRRRRRHALSGFRRALSLEAQSRLAARAGLLEDGMF